MNVRIYMTDQPLPASEVHPLAIVPDGNTAALPRHPQGLVWRYWATVDTRDTLLVPFRGRIETDVQRKGHCLLFEPLERLLSPLPLNAMRHRASRKQADGSAKTRLVPPRPAFPELELQPA